MSDRWIETTGKFKDFKTPKNELNARQYLVQKINEYSRNLNIKEEVYKEFLRCLISQINLSYVNDQGEAVPVKLHHGRQDRAVAKKFQENNIVLPYSTIFQSSVEEDTDKRRFKHVLKYSSKWNEDTQRAERVVSLNDSAVKLNYTLSIWSKYISHIDQMSATIRRHFNPSIGLTTPFSDAVTAFLTEESDISSVEVADKEDRIIRKTFTITLESYIQSPKFLVTNTGKILHFNTEIWT